MIISELCQNHGGDLETVKEMVKLSAEAGAWGAKIQTFFARDLSEEFESDYQRLKKLELTWNEHIEFFDTCKKYDLIPITTINKKEYLPILANIGFRWVKIASPQATDTALIKLAKGIGFNVIVSTGGWDVNEITRVEPVECVMHCVSKYPHSPYEANLLRMMAIKSKWRKSPVGWSDHTDPLHKDWDLPTKYASALGAAFIEKHFTIKNRNETKDGPVSIDFNQLKSLCDFDRLQPEEKINKLNLGIMIAPEPIEGRQLIEKYARRWTN